MARPPANRPGRRPIFIFALLGFVLPGALLFVLHSRLGESGAGLSVRRELPTKAITALAILLATWVVSRLEGRPLGDYGFPPRQAFGRRFWEGTAWGFAMLSALLLLVRMSGGFQIDSMSVAGGAAVRYALGWGLTFLAVAVSEELGFRGYLLCVAARRIAFWRAALALSVGFAAAHLGNHGENTLGIVQVFATGMLFCFTIRRTGNLWFALGFHAAWDWAQTFFYGTADSGLRGEGHLLNSSTHGPAWLTGGSAGPEGSVLALVVLALCALLVHLRFPRALYPDRPS